jgi:hypothetical protein
MLGQSQAGAREDGMDLKSEVGGRFARLISIACLLVGLSDTFRMLGVSNGSTSPIMDMGATAFVLLAIFALARLFAAVGLWIQANWGGVLLLGVSVAELGLYLYGSRDIDMTAFGFIIRLLLFVGMILLFLAAWRRGREAVHD